jgi:hypothetical protein
LAILGCRSAPERVVPPAPAARASDDTGVESAPASITWDVKIGAGWQMEQRICWEGAPITVVMPEARAGLQYAVAVEDDQGRALEVTSRGAAVDEAARCATVTVDLGRAAQELDHGDTLRMADGAIFGSPDVWLWRPEPWPAGAVGALSLTLPEGMEASLPWPRADDERYLVDATTWKMMCKHALGRLKPRTLEIGEATFTLTQLPGALAASEEGLDRWLTEAARAVSLVSGRFPVSHAQVLVVPVQGGRAIPFGMAMRGGGPTAMMLLSSRAGDAELVGEWVGVHELSHLLLPPVNREDAWLSEGLASYYQETLRGRAGIQDVEEAWAQLLAGFARGKRAAKNIPLAEASARMHRDFGYLHVYWGGAALLFRLDVELRRKGRSLDELVAAVREREPKDVRYRSAAEVLGWMAAAAPDVDVSGIVGQGLAQPFPPVEDLLRDLGVERGRGGKVRFVDDAPLAAIRRGIVAPPGRGSPGR